MSVNLSDIGGQLLQWLGLLEDQMDTSKLQENVRKSCCGKPLESRETAMGVLMDLSEVLRQHGLGDDSSELQILVAKKIDELAKEPLVRVAAPKADEKAPAAPKADAKVPAVKQSALPTNPHERKIVLIKREKQEIDEELKEAEGLEGDDEEIRGIRKRHFDEYKAELEKLLEKVEAAKSEAIPGDSNGTEAVVAKIPTEEPKAPAATPAEEPKAPPAPIIEKQNAPAVVSTADPELLVEISEREEKISSLQAELEVAESEDNQEVYIQSLRERLSSEVEELEHLKASL
jgi:hypothetical protein